MNKFLPPYETSYHDLAGMVSINLDDEYDFNALSAGLAGYDPNRYEAVALKVYINLIPIVTLYARDKLFRHDEIKKKLAVYKFKVEMSLNDLFFRLRNINFTVSTGESSY